MTSHNCRLDIKLFKTIVIIFDIECYSFGIDL